MPGPSHLHVHLDAPLPDELAAGAAGAATAVFVAGWCVPCGGRRIRALSFAVDGEPRPVGACGMPRLDVLRALDGGAPSYRSGFWGLVRVDRVPARLELRAELDDGTTVTAPLGELAAAQRAAPVDVAWPASGPRVAISMATFDPSPTLFARQVETIRAQTHANWVCVISDDGSAQARFAELEAMVAGDERFVVSRSPRRRGFYANFERALELAPADADAIALADQDDAWHRDKLAMLLAALGDAQLAYSDARLVAPDGTVLAETYWGVRRNNHADLRSLLVANAVTGAASLLRRDVLDVALPFPPAQFAHFHDHWIALCALAVGDIAYVDRPLYDYVQHGDAVLGHAAANQVTPLRERLASLRDDPRERVRLYRATYFVDVARIAQMATILLARAGDRMTRRKRRTLQACLRADGSLVGVAALWLRGVRDLAGRPETLGAERGLAYALAWRRLMAATARDRPARVLRLDAVPPATLAPRPGRREPDAPVRVVAEKIAPLEWAVRDDAPQRINLLVPTIDLGHLFGGYIAKFNLARRLAEHGRRVRIVTVDPTPPLPPDWRAQVERYEGLAGVFDHVEVAFGRESPGGIEASADDAYVATTWWTAHVAAAAARGPFLYLIQEYEPFTFPMGTWGALAEQSYRFEHVALFSTELLREFFRRHALGVYAAGEAAGDAASVAFQNAITPVVAPSAEALAARRPRRLLFYARPEAHAARNLFELGAMALGRAARDGAFAGGWELRGIGTTALGRRLALGGGASLELLPRSAQADYARLLAEHDVGLALMHTPHPSLVPIEMASAGMLTVTSTFEHKTPEAMRAISPNILAAEATVEAVAAALGRAVACVDDVAARVTGANVDWPTAWDTALPAALLDRVLALLRGLA